MLKTKYDDTNKSELEKKIPNVTDFIKKVNLTALGKKIPDVSNLATKLALTTVENKIPDVSSLVKKTDYNAKNTEIENKLNNHNFDKYISTLYFNTLAKDAFNAILAQANLVTKTNFDNTVSSLDGKIAENKTKIELNKLKTFDSSYFVGKSHFEEYGIQNYLVFEPLNRYFKEIPILIMFHLRNLKDYLLKVFNHLQHLVIVLL